MPETWYTKIMCDKNKIEKLFEAMSERLYRENDLSDMTYALCKCNEDFKTFFLNYCFDEPIKIEFIGREYSRYCSRPDFFAQDMQGNEYLIEVKINDRNQHFYQYKQDFPKAKYAFISNYNLNKNELNKDDKAALPKWKIKTWKGFYDALSKSKLKEDSIVYGYLKYLKNLTEIKEFIKMNISQVKSLPAFCNNLHKIAEDKGFVVYTSPKTFTEEYYGYFFTKEGLYLWFGLFLPDGNIWIGLKNDESWITNSIKEKLNREFKNFPKTDLYETTESYEDNFGYYWFKLKEDKHKILCDDSKSPEEQQKVLEDFFVNVLEAISAEKYLG
ncbi:MAG: hypothetical protein K2I95_04795 [Treponemataceae bacterium]|nr:hypothetical protein [Treponemataceae bacterium]